jgi:hypothetical protein
MTPALEQRLRARGAKVCLAKPFDLDDLLSCIKRVLEPPATRPKAVWDDRFPHLRDLSYEARRRLDGTHVLLIRAEDALGWSQSRIRAYYAERGISLDGHAQPARRRARSRTQASA